MEYKDKTDKSKLWKFSYRKYFNRKLKKKEVKIEMEDIEILKIKFTAALIIGLIIEVMIFSIFIYMC